MTDLLLGLLFLLLIPVIGMLIMFFLWILLDREEDKMWDDILGHKKGHKK